VKRVNENARVTLEIQVKSLTFPLIRFDIRYRLVSCDSLSVSDDEMNWDEDDGGGFDDGDIQEDDVDDDDPEVQMENAYFEAKDTAEQSGAKAGIEAFQAILDMETEKVSDQKRRIFLSLSDSQLSANGASKLSNACASSAWRSSPPAPRR
jgi:hypothetical protein